MSCQPSRFDLDCFSSRMGVAAADGIAMKISNDDDPLRSRFEMVFYSCAFRCR